MKQKLVFTALPAGFGSSNQTLKLSVFISPQVPSTDEVVVNEIKTTLAQVKDMQKLPELLDKGSLMVQVGSNTPFAVSFSKNAAKQDLWKQLFTDKIKVKGYIPPEEDATKPILSYPVKLIAEHIKKVVSAVGNQFPTEMPGKDFYINNKDFTDIANYRIELMVSGKEGPLVSKLTTVENGPTVKKLLKEKPFIPFNGTMLPNLSFSQLGNFHGLYNVKTKDKPTPVSLPNFEFHDIVAVLSQYPQLMRRLGLVVDLEIPVSKLQANKGSIRVVPTGLEFTTPTELVCPATAYELTNKGFYTAATDNSMYNKGFVKINTPDFAVVQLDTDGGALKYISHIDALLLKTHRQRNFAPDAVDRGKEAALQAHGNETQNSGEGLPSLRSAGIAIVKNGMAEYLNSRFEWMNKLKTLVAATAAFPTGISNKGATYVPGQYSLMADDVVIGYRIDVKMTETDKPGTPNEWHSLHFQENVYSVATAGGAGTPIANIEKEEGFIQLSTTEDAAINEPHMKLSEVIGRWEGWSLAVPMPGKSLNEPTLSPPGKEVDTDAEEAEKFTTPDQVLFKLNVKPKIVKGTLPRLRFGHTYALKIRTVDMAGNSVAHTAEPELPLNVPLKDSNSVITGFQYRRYEPVDVPLLIPAEDFRDGESSQVMVIRSSEEETVTAFENNPKNKWVEQPKLFEAACTRHVIPPKTTVGMAITHGMLEKAIGLGATASGAVYKDIITSKDPQVTEANEVLKAKPVSSSTPLIDVGYLADPMAAGVAVYLSPADEHKALFASKQVFNRRLSFYFDEEVKSDTQANTSLSYEKWMAPKTFRIVLQESTGFNTEWSNKNGERKLVVSLPKGHTLKLNYACFWRPADLLKLSGILGMMGRENTTFSDIVGQAIAQGQHWMFSPWRTISFVHAVLAPLTSFTDNVTTTLNSPGAISATSLLFGNLPNATPIQYYLSNPLPQLNFINPNRNYNDNFASLDLNIDIHGASTGMLDIEAEWNDIVDDGVQALPKGYDTLPVKAKVYHLNTNPRIYNYNFGSPLPPEGIKSPIQKLADGSIKKMEPVAVKHLLNDTKHRMVNYKVVASTRYKEYFFHLVNQPGFDMSRITRTSNTVGVNILSSAPPLPPQIAYVLPIFEWGEAPDPKDPKTLLRGRSAGLRVYLRRPWYSSGEGEKLAVVTKSFTHPTNKPHLEETIYTTWGNDPARLSPGAGGIYPAAAAFLPSKINLTGGKFSEKELTIRDVPGAVSDIAAYDVQFDAEKNLYYADIMVFFGAAYFPFVKLALAAYQQHSVRKAGTDCCLSKVVRADYIQIPPPRFTSLKVTSAGIEVAISGTAAAPSNEFVTWFEMVIEQLNPRSENIIISTEDEVLEKDTHKLTANEINSTNFTFRYAHIFNARPKPFRVKILEYEAIPKTGFTATTQGSSKRKIDNITNRVVFADAYDVQ